MARQNKAEIVLTARDRTKSAFASVNKGLGRMAAFGLAGAAAGTILLTRAALRQIDALAKQAQLLGTSTEALAAFQLVSAKTGIEQKTLEKSLINVTRVVAEAAEGTGLAVDTLKKLGLEAKSLSQQRPEEQFLLIADAMKGVSTQSEKVLAAYELFGGRGAALLRTLEAGREGFDAAREATELYGTAISAVDAKSIEDANDAFTDLAESVKGVGFDLARRFAPGMEAASTSAANFIVTIRRDFIPAMALLLEQTGLLISNVRGLSDIELAVRIEFGEDEAREAEKAEQDFLARRSTQRALAQDRDNKFEAKFGAKVRTQRRIDELAAERESVEARLAEVRAEQERRGQIVKDADQKIADQKLAQEQEARDARFAAERDAEQEKFEEELELEADRIDEFVKLQARKGKAAARIRQQDLREFKRNLDQQMSLEERAAQNTIFLRQATAATSIQILQVLVGKNKTVARALFIVEKGLAIARTVQNTSAAAVKALAELGPIAGPPAAAAIQAYGAAQVGLIAATTLAGVSSVGGGFGGFGGGGGFASDGGFSESSSVEAPPSGGTAVGEQGVTQLIFPNVFGITPEAIDAIADALREASENRDVIIVSGQGRNAELLAGANG